MTMKYKYETQIYCPKKDTHRKQMFIAREGDDDFHVIIRHSYDGHGFIDNCYHIYTNEKITDGMVFRKRSDKGGDYFYIKLSKEEVINLFDNESVCF